MFITMKEVMEANERIGHNFFRGDTMEFWGSELHSEVFAGEYFVTCEDNFNRTARLYTIRKANADGSIDTVGDFQAYETLEQAKEAMYKLA